MALILIGVEGMTVIVDQSTVNPPGNTVVATIVVAPPTGTKSKGEGKRVHRDGDQITVTNISVPGTAPTPDPGPYTVPLNATATETKAEDKEVLREGDQSDTINATPQTPAPAPFPISFKCKISVANQTTSKAQ